jgi:hypothetical protein
LEKGFSYFGQTLMDDHKLVMISIFFLFSKHEKDANFFFFNENMIGKFLGFSRMHENIFFSF